MKILNYTNTKIFKDAPLAQLDRATAFYAVGHSFESNTGYQLDREINRLPIFLSKMNNRIGGWEDNGEVPTLWFCKYQSTFFICSCKFFLQ